MKHEKWDVGAGVFLWILRNFEEHLFDRTAPVVEMKHLPDE